LPLLFVGVAGLSIIGFLKISWVQLVYKGNVLRLNNWLAIHNTPNAAFRLTLR